MPSVRTSGRYTFPAWLAERWCLEHRASVWRTEDGGYGVRVGQAEAQGPSLRDAVRRILWKVPIETCRPRAKAIPRSCQTPRGRILR